MSVTESNSSEIFRPGTTYCISEILHSVRISNIEFPEMDYICYSSISLSTERHMGNNKSWSFIYINGSLQRTFAWDSH